MTPRATPFRVVLFDIDGTLVDSNDAHAHAWVEALAAFGFTVAFERVRPLIGKGGDKVLPELTGLQQDSPQGKAIGERRTQIFKTEYMPHLRAFPGVRPLLQHMRERGLTLVVATSAKEDELQGLLRIAGAEDLFAQAATSADAPQSKPDPDVVQAALARAGCRGAEAIMVGDTPYDIEAAAHAEVSAIAFRCGNWPDAELHGAIAIYDNAADMLARYAGSPLG